MRYQKCKMLFGKENFKKLQEANILILGVGGVGSYALDCLYRSGVINITIVDYDKFDITNQNRQIGSEAVGELKTKRFKELYPNIITINKKMDIDWVKKFNFVPYDLIIDCSDTTEVKIELAKKVYKKLIMSTGSAKRFDASKIEVGSIWKSYGDALAKKIRNKLKRVGFNRNFTVIFSSEEDRCRDNGSCVAVTGTFGLIICSEVIKRLLIISNKGME